MKVLYISSTKAGMLGQSIYYDLMQEFVDNGHSVYCVYANEKRFGLGMEQFTSNGINYLGVATGDLSKNPNLISKGIATLRIDSQFKSAIKNQFSSIDFDLILISTPPITFTSTLKYFKDKSVPIYLMLKDIFPQNAVDLQMFGNNSLIHKFFKRKEERSYAYADIIGCMSEANKDYVLRQHPNLLNKVDILPNAIKIVDDIHAIANREDYGINKDDLMLLYGGNIGLPQDPEFIKECIIKLEALTNVKLVIAGSGSHMYQIEELVNKENIKNTMCLGQLDVDTYNGLTAICDVGLIFLDYRFTIPNYPQRLLSYLKDSKPIICATDLITDIGVDAEENNYGVRVPSNDSDGWIEAVEVLQESEELRKEMGHNGYDYLIDNFNVKIAYDLIMKQLKEKHYV